MRIAKFIWGFPNESIFGEVKEMKSSAKPHSFPFLSIMRHFVSNETNCKSYVTSDGGNSKKIHYLCNHYYQRYYKTNEEYEKIIGIITAPGHRERLCPEPSYP